MEVNRESEGETMFKAGDIVKLANGIKVKVAEMTGPNEAIVYGHYYSACTSLDGATMIRKAV